MFKMTEKNFLGLGAAALVIGLIFSPLVGEAQASGISPSSAQGAVGQGAPPLPLSDVVNLIDQVSSKIVQGGQALQNLAGGATGMSQTVTTQTGQTVGSGYNVSGLIGLWNNINNWFTQNVGTSLGDVIKAVVSFMIYIWTIIIKLLEALVAHL